MLCPLLQHLPPHLTFHHCINPSTHATILPPLNSKGFAAGSIEGRVALEYFDEIPNKAALGE